MLSGNLQQYFKLHDTCSSWNVMTFRSPRPSCLLYINIGILLFNGFDVHIGKPFKQPAYMIKVTPESFCQLVNLQTVLTYVFALLFSKFCFSLYFLKKSRTVFSHFGNTLRFFHSSFIDFGMGYSDIW